MGHIMGHIMGLLVRDSTWRSGPGHHLSPLVLAGWSGSGGAGGGRGRL